MGQLKASEVRLLLIFLITVLVLVSFFGYEWYAKGLRAVKSQQGELQAQRDSLISMKSQQIDYNQKRVWMNKNQPIARDEFEAKEALDRILSVQGIEAAGLTLVSSPPEKAPSQETYYWAFERRVVVAGGIQNIVQWLASLQSETSFRVITHLHLFPKKVKEPESLTCEVTIEQRYATEEILAMSNVSVISSGSDLGDMTPAASARSVEEPVSMETPEAESAGSRVPTVTKRPTVTPPSFNASPTGSGGTTPPEGAPARPRVRLPGAPPTPPAAEGASGETGLVRSPRRPAFASSDDGRVLRGGPTPPPLMPDDEAAGPGGNPVSPGIELVPDTVPDEITDAEPIIDPEPTVVPVESGLDADAPSLPQPYDSVSTDTIVGEHWDGNTPGVEETAIDETVSFEGAPQTN